jgi:aspartyl-tRNA(Asn)/glutamyl-tRNA(Gln) amidotransferase subunit B
MRADVNVSLHREREPLGTKVEVKNLNSFKSVASALSFEIRRQTLLLEAGRPVVQETRGWNEGGQKTYLLRSKEGSADYRYMPEPDLPPLHIGRARIDAVLASMPELPARKRERYLGLGVREADADLLAFDVAASAFFDEAMGAYSGPPQTVANWLNGDVAGHLHASGGRLGTEAFTPAALASLMRLIDEGTISGKIAKSILPEVLEGADPAQLVRARGLTQVADEGALEALVDRVLEENPAIVASIEANPKAVNALLGSVMKASRGTAKPDLVRRMLSERLGLAEAG